jgi:hypothetical protein
MSNVDSQPAIAEAAVHSLVEAIREALACGMKCTDESGSFLDTAQVGGLFEQSQKASACVTQIQDALLASLEQPKSSEEGMKIFRATLSAVYVVPGADRPTWLW